MNITSKILTEKGIQLNLDTFVDTIDSVYIYNSDKFEDIEDITKYSQIPQYSLDKFRVTIKPEDNTPALIFIRIDYTKDEVSDKLVTMFINDYSVFKAKIKYLEYFDDDCCNKQCKEHGTLLNVISYMYRLNLMYDCYLYDNKELTIKYYNDIKRFFDLDNISFECVDLNPSNYNNPDKVHDLFDFLNETVKNTVSPCTKSLFESLLLKDLYSLLFATSDKGGKLNWILEDHIWDMDNEVWYNDKIWKD